MSDNINKMDIKQLRNAVQLLSDELAIMKRKYEDIIYNLDTDNFSSRFVKEQGDMKTAIEITAEGIKTKVSKEDLKAYSTIEQTAEQIKSTVTKEFVVEQFNGEIVTNAILSSQIAQKADEIYLSVSQDFETKDNANSNYNDLSNSISSVSIKANSISTRVGNVEDGEFNGYTLFEQTGSKFSFTGDVEISGNAIVGGIITGSALQNSDGTAKVELGHYTGSSVGDLNLFRISSDGTETNVFSVYDNFTSIDLLAFGTTFLYSSGNTTYPMGYWDFQFCDTNIGGGGTGGSAVAVFG